MSDSVEKLWQRAQRHLSMQQPAPARAVLEMLVARDPTHQGALLLLGGIAWSEGHIRTAARNALAAAAVETDDPAALAAVVNALLQVGEMAAAHELLRHPALQGHAVAGTTLLQLARSHQALDEHAAALACYERARAQGMDDVEFRFYRATQLAFNGRLDEAEAELEHCVGTGMPIGRAFVELGRLRRQTATRNHLGLIRDALPRVAPDGINHADLEFARYKELEDLGRNAEAWDALAHANALMAARLPMDAARDAMLQDAFLRVCTAEFLAATPHADFHDPQPIFVIGMPRSGTTLLDRLLGSHAEITSAGELRDFGLQMRWVADDYGILAPDERLLERIPALDYAELGQRYLAQTRWRARGKARYIDKFPGNWVFAGLICKALPGARVVNMVRAPMDVCFSNFRTTFGDTYPWSYELGRLASQYRQYRKSMAHWHAAMPGRIMDVAYADLVADPEATMRRVVAFCGLQWDPRGVDAARNDQPIATLSYAQARQPIHRGSLDAWRRYARQLEPLRSAIEC